jgi:hypothetical protein
LEAVVPYLIDASNLGGALGGAQGARDAVAVVCRLVEWTRDRGRVVAVFDGEERGQLAIRYGALELVWGGAGRSADDEIVRRLGATRGGLRTRDWIVVTNDRELARRCRDLGARVERSGALADRLDRPAAARAPGARGGADPAHDKPPANAEEREHWRKIFGDDG